MIASDCPGPPMRPARPVPSLGTRRVAPAPLAQLKPPGLVRETMAESRPPP